VPHEWIDAPKQVAGRDAVLKIEEIKELVLIPVLPTHHDKASAAANRQQTESLVAKNHEGFFNIIGQIRSFGDAGSMSGLAPGADIVAAFS
jgi:hypothetical protein